MSKREEGKFSDSEESDVSEHWNDEKVGEIQSFDLRKPYSGGRRGTVVSQTVKVSDDWIPPVYKKTNDEKIRIKNAIIKNLIFRNISEANLEIVINAMSSKMYLEGEDIILEGAEGDSFYLIDEGVCNVYIKGKGKVAEIEGGHKSQRNYFGELALLYDSPRAATVSAATDTSLWVLDRITFKKILQGDAQKKQEMYKTFLEKVPLLQSLSYQERQILADALEPRDFDSETIILQEGESGNDFFIIEEGEVVCTKTIDGKTVKVSDYLGPGDFFGELALLAGQNNAVRRATVTATKPTKLVAVERETFKRLLGPLESILKGREEIYQKYVEDSLNELKNLEISGK